ncbi:metal-dependent hydrolase [Alkalicoccobacillus porphyridii]|uniref:Metal-dependent hydrolase n=1 Tax=Alkalicoccobacillus porphyridii TaxID=2597270 RepID=A0A553ZT87_9BACI|nr:metal-dependent hydrolase [Alkalicoccobacillus porphyridii]TSB44694.1 metal-dependent hydrolase [Alkalicoccobacillus porphyridii]
MDTITHTLFGLTTYGMVDKREKDRPTKRALLFTALAASQAPDLDIVARVTETGRVMDQMWHRGLTHSIFVAPIWALIIYVLAYVIWRRKDRMIFYLALVNVFIHIGSDSLNAWGTGFFEPFSSMRVTIGVIPIIDLVVWTIFLGAFLIKKWSKTVQPHRIWRIAWVIVLLHVGAQAIQGMMIHEEARDQYEQTTLTASFIPGHFTVYGKEDGKIYIDDQTIWSTSSDPEIIVSEEQEDLTPLLEGNPRAEVLMAWSPFVVITTEDGVLGVYDPRFNRSGAPMLFEYVELE